MPRAQTFKHYKNNTTTKNPFRYLSVIRPPTYMFIYVNYILTLTPNPNPILFLYYSYIVPIYFLWGSDNRQVPTVRQIRPNINYISHSCVTNIFTDPIWNFRCQEGFCWTCLCQRQTPVRIPPKYGVGVENFRILIYGTLSYCIHISNTLYNYE